MVFFRVALVGRVVPGADLGAVLARLDDDVANLLRRDAEISDWLVRFTLFHARLLRHGIG
jgi:hypothetical protein